MYKTGDMVHILDHALPNAPAEQQAALRGQIGKLVDQVYADGELSLWLVQVGGHERFYLYQDEFELWTP
jgi:hypothetical protein